MVQYCDDGMVNGLGGTPIGLGIALRELHSYFSGALALSFKVVWIGDTQPVWIWTQPNLHFYYKGPLLTQ